MSKNELKEKEVEEVKTDEKIDENVDKKIDEALIVNEEVAVEVETKNGTEIDVKNNTNNSENNDENKNNKTEKKGFKPLSIITKITNIILWAIALVALSLLLLTVASQRTDIFGYRIYLIMSGSMEPTIHVKDAIITQQIDTPTTGDVIAFENGGIVTVHRIVQEYTEGDNKLYQTKGDNNNTIDSGLVQKSQIKGKVICNISFLGKSILYLQSHTEIIFFAVGFIIIIAIAKALIRRLM